MKKEKVFQIRITKEEDLKIKKLRDKGYNVSTLIRNYLKTLYTDDKKRTS